MEQQQATATSSPPPSSPPRMSTESPKLKMKDPTELMAVSPALDLMKSNPFLQQAQFLALNPNLYAAQLAQLQAAQILLARQQQEALLGVAGENGEAKKRAADEDIFSVKNKLPRAGSPLTDFHPKPETPLDLSGSKSPDMKSNYFNPLMPAGLLSFFNQLRPPHQASVPDFSPRKSPSLSPPARHASPWSAQWSNKSMDSAKPEDVFKCVWCKESYQSLEALTVHMKEAKHHSMPTYPHHLNPLMPNTPPSSMSSPMRSMPSPTKAPGRDILRDQMPLPRKLVRGQDVWIGKADEQTRDILKCMGCGASFRSLDLLTKHMQETQHYKKVISHDQLSSWKYPESQTSVKNHVNSVLTCKVCDKGFSSLKELSDHMVRANHYAPGSDGKMPGVGRGNHSSMNLSHQQQQQQQQQHAMNKERKKALPVKKLLELERARQEVAGNFSPVSAREIMESGKLFCERCEEKIPIDIFIPHIQQCVGKPRFLKNAGPEPTSPTVGNKEGNGPTKSDGKDKDGTGSILGSLELLVKGNFQNRQASAAAAGSPGPRFPPTAPVPQFSPDNKFSINTLFPSRSPALSSNSTGSKPPSPIPLKATLDKMDVVQKEEERKSPVSDHSMASPPPKSEEGKASPIPMKVASPAASPEVPTKKEGSGNPLAQLQLFCDDQKKTPRSTAGGSSSTTSSSVKESSASPMSDPGAILAFSWACNQAVGSDSAIKCPFCDTPFISKGAYRHHLSKMHFTKENMGGMGAGVPTLPPAATAARTPSPDSKEGQESLQSKYQKYSQLAKQLSCCEGTN